MTKESLVAGGQMLLEVWARDVAGVDPVPSEASSKGSQSVVRPLICLDK